MTEDEAKAEREHRIILHLCAKEGSDSQPYRDAGYDVRIIGREIGIENYIPPPGVYGIIANPPCTMFSLARSKAKTSRDLREGMRLVKECLRVIWECQYQIAEHQRHSPLRFWMLENPAFGFLKWFLGKPVFTYCQSEYGQTFTKRTALWGDFNLPVRPLLASPMPSRSGIGKIISQQWSGEDERSRCPIDFAKAFFVANP